MQAKSGNRDAFSMLMRGYDRRIYYAAYSFLHNADDAMDIVQEVLLRAYKNFASFDPGKALYPWLYRITRNLCINRVKRADNRNVSLPDGEIIAGKDRTPEAEVLRNEEAEEIRKAIDELSEPLREVVIMKTYQDCSYAEIAEILDIPIGTVMSRLYNARAALRTKLSIGTAKGK